MKISINTSQFRDRTLLVDMFDTATAVYEENAKDASFDTRLKEQFVRQATRGKELTMQLWRQKDLHEVCFKLDEGETDRWLIINMMQTSIDMLNLTVFDIKHGLARTMFLRRVARAQALSEMIENAVGRH